MMPIPLLNAYLTMLPRLQAEESLRRVAEQHASMPEVPQRDRRRIIADWQQQAENHYEAERLAPEQMAVRLAMMGIGMRRAKKDGN